MDTAQHRHQMGHEGHVDILPGDAAQRLNDFRGVSMAIDRIGLKVVARLAELGGERGLSACPAHPRLRVGDEPVQVDQIVLQERQKAE